MTSSALAPIEPVAPSTAIVFMAERDSSSADGEHGQRGEHAVQAIEHAAVAGEQRARILHAGLALDQAFEQIADDRSDDRQQAPAAPARPTGEPADPAASRRLAESSTPVTSAPYTPAKVLFGLICGRAWPCRSGCR